MDVKILCFKAESDHFRLLKNPKLSIFAHVNDGRLMQGGQPKGKRAHSMAYSFPHEGLQSQ